MHTVQRDLNSSAYECVLWLEDFLLQTHQSCVLKCRLIGPEQPMGPGSQHVRSLLQGSLHALVWRISCVQVQEGGSFCPAAHPWQCENWLLENSTCTLGLWQYGLANTNSNARGLAKTPSIVLARKVHPGFSASSYGKTRAVFLADTI